MKKAINKNTIEFAIAIIAGLLLFILFFGLSPLNVISDNWIYAHGGDLAEHYTGWRFFRASKWSLPLGSVDNIAYPDKISVIYLDCIPIVALFFKLLSPILPQTFQYMGAYEVLCFILQIYLGMKITEHFSKELSVIIPGGLLLGLSSPMIYRVLYHTALASHFLFLLAILIWINRKNITPGREILLWGLLGALNTFIHLFFVPIVGVLIVGIMITEVLRKNMKISQALLSVCSYIIGALIPFTILGGFGGNFNPVGAGAGYYSANLNALFNPFEYSLFLPYLPTTTIGQYEGMCYLGLGTIILSFIAFILLIINRKRIENRYFYSFLTGFIIILIISFAAGCGSNISFNAIKIADITYPGPIEALLNIFRSHGRFTWAVLYIFPVFSIGILLRFNSKYKFSVLILTVCFLIQLTDFLPYCEEKSDYNKDEYVNYMETTDVWEDISSTTEHIVFLPDGLDYAMHTRLFNLADYALKNNMTLDNYYYARPRTNYVKATQNQMRDALDAGNVIADTIIIFDDIFEPYYKNWNLHYYNLDNFIIGIDKELHGLEEIDFSKGIEIKINEGKNLINSTMTPEGYVICEKDAGVAAPEWNFEPGHYVLHVSTEISENISIGYFSTFEGDITNITTKHNGSDVLMEFDVEKKAYGMVFFVSNTGDEENIIYSMRLYKDL